MPVGSSNLVTTFIRLTHCHMGKNDTKPAVLYRSGRLNPPATLNPLKFAYDAEDVALVGQPDTYFAQVASYY